MIVSHNKMNKRKMAKTISLLVDDQHDIPEFIQIFLIDRLLWATTEYDDNGKMNKYFGVPFWSAGAIRKAIDNIKTKTRTIQDLIHEHSTPRLELGKKLDEMYKAKQTSEEDVFRLLDQFCHAVIVSKEEDATINKVGLRSRMPLSFQFREGDDVFCRYRQAGVEVFQLEKLDLINLAKGILPAGGFASLTCKKTC